VSTPQSSDFVPSDAFGFRWEWIINRAQVAGDLTAEFRKLAGYELGCAVLLEAKLRMCVQVVAPSGHLVVKRLDAIRDLHNARLHLMLKLAASTLGDARK
jgi:hypothetical protein